MNSKDSSTAILLFARSTNVERKTKRLSTNRGFNKSVIKVLNQKVKSVASKSTYKVFKYDEQHQIGNSFGERLTNGIKEIFSKGYNKVVIIGNDCPDLSLKDINLAGKLLSNNQNVIGPDLRGGTFLIGLNKRSFDAEAFQSLSWQETTLTESLIDYFGCRGASTEILAVKGDLNTIADLKTYLNTSARIFKKLVLLLKGFTPFPWTHSKYSLLLISETQRRGPPAF